MVRQLLRAFCAFWCLCENSLRGLQGGRFRFWLFVKCWGKSKTTKLNEGVHSMKQGCVLLFLNSRMRDVQNTRAKTRKITEAETNTLENFWGSLPKAGGKGKGPRGIKASQHKAGGGPAKQRHCCCFKKQEARDSACRKNTAQPKRAVRHRKAIYCCSALMVSRPSKKPRRRILPPVGLLPRIRFISRRTSSNENSVLE